MNLDNKNWIISIQQSTVEIIANTSQTLTLAQGSARRHDNMDQILSRLDQRMEQMIGIAGPSWLSSADLLFMMAINDEQLLNEENSRARYTPLTLRHPAQAWTRHQYIRG